MWEELVDNTYLEEVRKALSSSAYRNAIGVLWNAVVNDLRNKVIDRSLTCSTKPLLLILLSRNRMIPSVSRLPIN